MTGSSFSLWECRDIDRTNEDRKTLICTRADCWNKPHLRKQHQMRQTRAEQKITGGKEGGSLEPD